jgi:nicotinate-nucleotide--dimethylbenzimidazole phosphoribosyltransferase
MIEELVGGVVPVDGAAAQAARARHARLAKPPGSLGRLEELGCRLAAIAGRCPPPVPAAPALVVAAADHGVHAQGVSDWPQAVTAAMVATVAAGRASVSAIARTVGARVSVLDVGTVTGGALAPGVRDARVRAGTRDSTVAPAMTAAECRAAVAAGGGAATELLAGGADLLATGDLGIANTTASACLIAAFTGAAPATVTGRGANRDHARVPRKVRAVERALARHGDGREPLPTLASLGGLEHAALVGVILAGAAARVPVVLDGVIAGAAAVAAVAACPAAAGYLVCGHTSAEPGARAVLDRLGQPALLDLGMRLGEGTGALLAVPLVQAAARVLTETATLTDVAGH